MPTDHQVTESRASRIDRKLGMTLAAALIVVLFDLAIWAMTQ